MAWFSHETANRPFAGALRAGNESGRSRGFAMAGSLTLRELNRATLARQSLLERASLGAAAMIERLVGLQAQLASAPAVGLWTRLAGFRQAELARLIEERSVVKATLMRATLHLCTASDYPWLRAAVQPALTAAADQIARQRKAGALDREELLAAATRFLSEEPRSYAEITAMLEALKPGQDAGAMRYSVRTHLPLIQVPSETRFSYPGNPVWTLAEKWLGRPIPTEPTPDSTRTLIRRYLAAFGPATMKDFETWSYVADARTLFEGMRDELVAYRDERKRELFDLPGLPLPDADTPAPPRFLPEFDNLLLSYEKRSRVVPEEHRKEVFLPGLRVAATILVDGFAAGSWATETKRGSATLAVRPFARFDKKVTAVLTEEGERLLRFLEPEAKGYEVRFSPAG